jgi:hypothetical protein
MPTSKTAIGQALLCFLSQVAHLGRIEPLFKIIAIMFPQSSSQLKVGLIRFRVQVTSRWWKLRKQFGSAFQ